MKNRKLIYLNKNAYTDIHRKTKLTHGKWKMEKLIKDAHATAKNESQTK